MARQVTVIYHMGGVEGGRGKGLRRGIETSLSFTHLST